LSEGIGAGIYVGYNSAPIITSNTIRANVAGNASTDYQVGSGAGIAMYSRITLPNTKINFNWITGNSATDQGGGVTFHGFTRGDPIQPALATFDDNVIDGNNAFDGGAIHTTTTRAKIYNNTIHNNTTIGDGGGIYFGETDNVGDVPELVNNLVTSNHIGIGSDGGGFFVELGVEPVVRYNDLWGNQLNNVGGARTDADYIGINGNISANPQYVNSNAVPPDYNLLQTSPAVDAGDNAAVVSPTYPNGAPRIQDGEQRRRRDRGHGSVRVLPRLRWRRDPGLAGIRR
jgi:hypothetical protein